MKKYIRWILASTLSGVLVTGGFSKQSHAEGDGWILSFAEDHDIGVVLRLVQWVGIQIRVNDAVVDGCWTNIDAVRTAVELSLRRSNIKISSNDESPVSLWIDTNGYALGGNISGGCVGTATLTMYWTQPASNFLDELQYGQYVQIMWSGSLFTSGRGETLNDQFRTFASESSDALVLRMLRANTDD